MPDMKLSEAVQRTIDLATRIRQYWEAELPKRHPNYPLVNPGEGDGPPPPEEKQLRQFLAGLPEDLLYKLALLMHLGRGDFPVGELAERYEELKQDSEKPEWAVEHLVAKVALADYLTEGLEELKTNRINVDNLPLKRSRSRK
jgi:hypothetical protein